MVEERHHDANASLLGHRYLHKLEQGGNMRMGFGLFVGGVVLALLALLLIIWSYSYDPWTETSQYYTWIEPGYAMAMLSLPLVLLAVVVLLPPPKVEYFLLSFAGAVVTLFALIGFLWAYPYDWYHYGEDYTLPVLLVYAIGVGMISIATAAALREHAAEIIRSVTEIHQPDSSSGTEVSTDTGSGSTSGLLGAVTQDAQSGTESRYGEADTELDPSPPEETFGQTNVNTGFDTSASEREFERTGYDEDVRTDTRCVSIDDGDETILTLVINGEEYQFADGETFGRRPGPWLDDLKMACDGSEGLSYLSSEHVKFTVEDGNVYVADLSQNGTKLNGRDMSGRLEELSDGDTLVLADRAKLGVKL